MLTFLSNNYLVFNDLAQPWQLGFQDGASPGFTGIVELHDTIFYYLVIISVGVFWLLGSIIYFYNSTNTHIIHKYLNHGTLIELIWTITPALILIAIAFPSFRLLYLLDEVTKAAITIKVTGHQWYWSYEYSDYVTESGEAVEFDSYMIPDADLEKGQFRLLDVDQRLIIPADTHIRLILTSEDVIHNYAVPSLGLKPESVPGRLNQTSIFSDREGIFYGQCSEICGVYHANMPTAVESVSSDRYIEFLGASSLLLTKKILRNLKKWIVSLQLFISHKNPFPLQSPLKVNSFFFPYTQNINIFIKELKLIFLLPAGPRFIKSRLGFLSLFIFILAGISVRSSMILSYIPDTALNIIFIVAIPYVLYSLNLVILKLIVVPQIFNNLKIEYKRSIISLRVIFGYYLLNLVSTIFILFLSFWSFSSIILYFNLGSIYLNNLLNYFFTAGVALNLNSLKIFSLVSQNTSFLSFNLLAFISLIFISSPFFYFIAKYLKVNTVNFNLEKILAISNIFSIILILSYMILPFLGVIINFLVPGLITIECQPESNTSENNTNISNNTEETNSSQSQNNSNTNNSNNTEGNNSSQSQNSSNTNRNSRNAEGVRNSNASGSQNPTGETPARPSPRPRARPRPSATIDISNLLHHINFPSERPQPGQVVNLNAHPDFFKALQNLGVKSYDRVEDMPMFKHNRPNMANNPSNIASSSRQTLDNTSIVGTNPSNNPVRNRNLVAEAALNQRGSTVPASVSSVETNTTNSPNSLATGVNTEASSTVPASVSSVETNTTNSPNSLATEINTEATSTTDSERIAENSSTNVPQSSKDVEKGDNSKEK